MKWYSVRTHRPSITCSDFIVRTRGGGIELACNIEMSDGNYHWVSFDDIELNDVTHFIILEPIEIEA